MVTHRPIPKEDPSLVSSAKKAAPLPRNSSSNSNSLEANGRGESDDNDFAGIELKPLMVTTIKSGGAHEHTSDVDENEENPTALHDDYNDDDDSGSDHDHNHNLTPTSARQRTSSGITTGSHVQCTAQVGTATNAQVAVNIFISFMGAGLLGQPYAFKVAGWMSGSIAVACVSAANVYAMLLLVKTRKKLELVQENKGTIKGYGDIGRLVGGPTGERFVNLCLVISQVGFATAYIIFIAANIHAVIPSLNRATICFGCVPVLCLLVQAQDMKTLSPFSLIADVANLLGLSAVFLQDFESYERHHEIIQATTNFRGIVYVASVAIYSLEGVNLVLPLESSCADRKGFPVLLIQVITGITMLMISFGCAGYVAFGSATEAPITLNLADSGPWGNFVKVALSLALYLTYPVMMYPVGHVLEETFDSFRRFSWQTRALVVLVTSTVAYGIPSFGEFLGLVGSSICMILGFILPCYFHLKVFGTGEVSNTELFFDLLLMILGTVMGAVGTYSSLSKLISGTVEAVPSNDETLPDPM